MKCVLIVEVELTTAFDLAFALIEDGIAPVGPAFTLDRALHHVSNGVDGAIVTLVRGGVNFDPLLQVMANRKLPFVIVCRHSEPVVLPTAANAIAVDGTATVGQIVAALRACKR